MKKREAALTTIFGKYLEASKPPLYGYYELKQTTKNSLSFASVDEHQYQKLKAAQANGFRWKHSDVDPRQKAMDYQFTPPLTSYIVIRWKDVFTMITYDKFVHERDTATRKSITKERALQIATKVVYL